MIHIIPICFQSLSAKFFFNRIVLMIFNFAHEFILMQKRMVTLALKGRQNTGRGNAPVNSWPPTNKALTGRRNILPPRRGLLVAEIQYTGVPPLPVFCRPVGATYPR